MTQPGSTGSPLKVSLPDSAEGRNGPELRGVFWKEPSPEMSWFAMKWEADSRILTMEFYPSSMTSEIWAMVETALDGVTAPVTVRNPYGGHSVLRRSISNDQVENVPKKLGEVLGTGWERSVARLLATEPRSSRQRRPAMWYGIPREQIQWYPIIDPGRCDGCGKCVEFCRNDVLRLSGEPPRAGVDNPFSCLVGCHSCASKCPTEAIQFPPRETLRALSEL